MRHSESQAVYGPYSRHTAVAGARPAFIDRKETRMTGTVLDAERIARTFLETTNLLAPELDLDDEVEDLVPWEDLPAPEKSLLIETFRHMLDHGVVRV